MAAALGAQHGTEVAGAVRAGDLGHVPVHPDRIRADHFESGLFSRRAFTEAGDIVVAG